MSFSPTLCYTAGMASIIKDGKVEQRPGALSHVRADLEDGRSLTTQPPESKEIDAEEGITEHGIQLYVLSPVGWKFRAFISHLSYRGIDWSAGFGTWAAARGWIRVEGIYKPDYDCDLDGAELIQVLNGKKRVLRERRFEVIHADKDLIGEINLTLRYE